MEKVVSKRQMGSQAEKMAAHFLEGQGFSILSKNYSIRQGEIDLIACQKKELHFVEVKLRNSAAYGSGREAVGYLKQKRMEKTAYHWMMCYPQYEEFEKFFSVVEIDASYKPQAQINWIPNAFSLR
ncbi:MAG: YraN family protein [Deltaproteobacteria bacterium RIFCSPLOWO2_12_FULL_40_28]|nr:MAG: YraN family protein [Deltaproteobacteria bacterium RIFCSPHIGHO2_02_FULL_40_28]OGQ20790.1 MAG: YraN family protein [Deltaproteobacteria bacterium RIFCSPHIGHO2_12_FULL_40_32]OGQ39191.1 MAG: YraN family protein [Deltaproteobacteria bacterium RIFCSPLOWO2_02_FULL_40_36]OGQ54471.1 MAG: YraN family protein [Deltaproteobacteria bacterium RIFCSPLOWO2_12_FULL_40_28]